MSEAKHTPGPWRGEWSGTEPPAILAQDGGRMIRICTMAGSSGNPDVIADARVVVAAPDLLLALAWLHDLEQGRRPDEYADQKALAMSAARAALAKATGEAQP